MSHTDKELNWQIEQISSEGQKLWLAAKQGDTDAQFQLGKALQHGTKQGIYRDDEEAIHWLRQAAEHGHIQAKYYLSQHPKNEENFSWLRQLAEQGYAEAQVDLARAYQEKKDITQAIYWLRQAAEQEDTVNELTQEFHDIESPQNRARYELGQIYQYGKDGITKDYKQALYWHKKAADHGSKLSKGFVESVQQQMQGIEECRRAAEQGDAKAQYCLGEEEDSLGHYEKALDWYQKSAKQGYIEAQFHLAQIYETGQNVVQNHEQAIYWYRQIAERNMTELETDTTQFGFFFRKAKNETQENYEKQLSYQREWLKDKYVAAQFNLGYAYENGEGIRQDDKQAVYWYRQAAKNGHKRAQFFLGCAYYDGQGVPQDYQQAIYWYQQAAQDILNTNGYPLKKGDIDAQFNLAYAYQKGEAISQDDGKAVYWYAKVARQGDAEAQLQLGKIYDQAEITQDYEQLISWYRELQKNHYASIYFNEQTINQQLEQEDQEKARYIESTHWGGPKGYKKHLVSKCKQTATHWYQEAEKQGYSKALLYLGVQQNEESTHWLCQLAINTILGNEEYDELELSEEDDEKVIALLHHQAEQGFSVAQTILAYLYKTGNAIPQDQQKARFWFEKATQQEDIVAQYWLGDMYFEELDFEELDFEKAQDYFQQACQNSHDGGYDELDVTKIESLAKDKLTLIQKYFHEQEKQRKIEEAKEAANKQMLSFLTHTLNNSLGTAPEMVRQTIRLLSHQYQKDTAHYKAINNVISLFATFSIVENLLQTFKQYIVEPETFQLSWQADNQGEGTIDLIIAFALRQTLSRIFFQLPEKLEELLPPNTDVNLKQLRQSFIDEVVALELNHQNTGQVFAWIKQHFDIFTQKLINTQHIHFEENKTRFTFLFSVFSEIIFNALKYSNGQNPIKLAWTKEAESYCFTCSNYFNPNLRYREQGSQKGLIFIDKLMTMLKDSRLEHHEENNLFTVKLIFSKTHFE